MSGEEAQIYRYRLPLTQPLQVKHQTMTEREGLIVILRGTHGECGIGEIAPLPGFSEETLESALSQARESVQVLVKRRHMELEHLFTGVRAQDARFPSVRFGLEAALLGLQAAFRGHAPALELSASACDAIPLNALVMGDAETAARQAAERVGQGYAAVKLKVGRGPIDGDIERVRVVRAALPSVVTLRLDANRAWSFDEAVRFVEGIGDCALEYIEEPLSDPRRLPGFERATGISYAVDETLQQIGWRTVMALRQEGWSALEESSGYPQRDLLEAPLRAAAWVIKPTLVGLPLSFFTCEGFEDRFDVKIVVSSAFESGVGLVTLANLAAALADAGTPAGLDTQQWFGADTLRAPLPVEGGRLPLASANQLMKALNDSVIEDVTHV